MTIDGPAGAGKSTVARRLAQRLHFQYLDTGAMYRAVTWSVLDAGIDPAHGEAVARVAANLNLEFKADRIWVDGRDVSREIREPRVTEAVSQVADHLPVRSQLVEIQRQIAARGDFVCEGRDQGTVAFPHADVKFFLTASVERRSIRRWQELREAGHEIELVELERQQRDRDSRDESRPVGGLRRAPDAIIVDTDQLDAEQVVNTLERYVREKQASAHHE